MFIATSGLKLVASDDALEKLIDKVAILPWEGQVTFWQGITLLGWMGTNRVYRCYQLPEKD